MWQHTNVLGCSVVLEESPFPGGSSRTNLQVLVLRTRVLVQSLDRKSLTLDHKVLEKCQGLRILQTVRYVCM